MPAEVSSSVEEKLKAGWHSSLADGLAAAEREQKPVLIDFWATWCKNCLVMDKTTLKNPEVMPALERYVKIKFQAEDPDASPAKELIERRRNWPSYLRDSQSEVKFRIRKFQIANLKS